MELASRDTREVTANIAEVGDAANQAGATHPRLPEAAGALARQAERLSTEVHDFIADVRTA